VEIERLLQNLIDKTVLFGHFQQNAAVFTPVSGNEQTTSEAGPQTSKASDGSGGARTPWSALPV
jgi:hypothetical protein